MRARFAAFVLAPLVAACGLIPGERPDLILSNGTTLDLTLFVNDQPVAVSLAGGPGLEIDESGLPQLPWVVEAQTTSGRVVVSITVNPGDVTETAYPDGRGSFKSVMERVDLSCGTVVLLAGRVGSFGPARGPDAGQPGDCEP